jgi:toxin YoeB
MMAFSDGVRQLTWTTAAWDDCTYRQGQDKKTLNRMDSLLKGALGQPFEGVGKPVPLKEN